ncbi:hypothetical protein MFRU_023g00130 [Monilinia fructicola]|uniref:Cep57 centrosome microtubule-binding domain-containing protein n=1 Tax=Monilinia fructicola TaxID=38448 RepID=A0A5M9KDQ6_MONFR|nr:hypothetical protein EYC84_007109 [Monilinia fructicola]KAG4028176.1 hypothetical protein MFRU_023g00130 [Monilinia fructicola]
MARNEFEDTLSSISSSQNLPQRPKSRFQFNNSTTSSHGFDPNSTNTQHHTVSTDSQNSFNYFDPDNSAEQCFMSTDLDIERRKRKQARRADIEIRDTAKKYNRWSPRKEADVSVNMNDVDHFFEDFTGGSSQINGSNNSSKLISKLAKLDQDTTPCRISKPKLSERLTSASKKNSRFNTTSATQNNPSANTPRRVVKDILDDHEFSLDLTHSVHNKENILPRQRSSHIPGMSKNVRMAPTEYNERQVLAELETLIKEHPANSSIRSGKVAKAASPTFTMSTTVNGSFSLPEVQNITKLVDNTSVLLPKKIEILEQPTQPMGKEEVDIYRSIDELQQQVAMLLNERKEQDSVITSLRSKLNERDEQAIVVSTLRHERKEQDAIISSLKNERDEKDKVITTLHDQNNQMAKEIQRLETDLRTKQNETEKMASAISGSETAAKLSQSQNAEIEKAMAEMKSKNEDLRADVENMAKQRDMVLDRYKNLVERFDALQRSTDAETSQPKENPNTEPTPNQAPDQGQKNSETLNGPETEFQDEDDIDDTADITMRPTMEPQLALKQIMSNVHNQIEQLTAQHSAKSAELRALDKSKNLRLRRSIAESLKMLVDQISSHSDFLYRLKDVSYAF